MRVEYCDKDLLNVNNFSDSEQIVSKLFPNDVEGTVKMIEKIIDEGIVEVENTLTNKNTGRIKIRGKEFFRYFFTPYSKECGFVSACVQEASKGICRLRIVSACDYPELSRSIVYLDNKLAVLKCEWIPKLKELRKRKRRKNYIITAIVLILHVIFYVWLFQHR